MKHIMSIVGALALCFSLIATSGIAISLEKHLSRVADRDGNNSLEAPVDQEKYIQGEVMKFAERATRDALKEMEMAMIQEFRKEIMGQDGTDSQYSYVEGENKFAGLKKYWKLAKEKAAKAFSEGKKAVKSMAKKVKEAGAEALDTLLNGADAQTSEIMASLRKKLQKNMPPRMQEVVQTVLSSLMKSEAIDEAHDVTKNVENEAGVSEHQGEEPEQQEEELSQSGEPKSEENQSEEDQPEEVVEAKEAEQQAEEEKEASKAHAAVSEKHT